MKTLAIGLRCEVLVYHIEAIYTEEYKLCAKDKKICLHDVLPLRDTRHFLVPYLCL